MKTEIQNPKWWMTYLSESEVAHIESAIAESESRTSGEIVPVIVRSSIAKGHVPWMCFLVLLLIFWSLTPFVMDLFPGFGTLAWEAVSLVISAAGALFLSCLAIIQRALTPESDERQAVERRALLEFHLSRIMETEHRTGVMIFISLLERKAVILADKTISAKIPDEAWKKTVMTLASRLRNGDFKDGLVTAIKQVGDTLSIDFPPISGKSNELPNDVIFKN